MQTGKDIIEIIKSQGRNIPKIYVANLKDVLNDNWDYIIDQELAYQFSATAYSRMYELKTKEINILKEVISRTALVYKTKPERNVIINEREIESENDVIEKEAEYDETYNEVVNQDLLNVLLKRVNFLTEGLNHVLLQVVYDEGELKYNVHTFDNCEIFTDDEDYRKIRAIKYYVGLELPNYYDVNTDYNGKADPYSSSKIMKQGGVFERYQYSYVYYVENDGTIWVHKYKFQNGEEIEVVDDEFPKQSLYANEEGKYILPFVLFSSEYQTDSILNFTGNDDLLDATINTALNITHLNELLKYQSHLQGVIRTSDKDKFGKNLKIGAGNFLVIEAGDTGEGVDVLNMQANFEMLWKVIKERIQTVMMNRGVKMYFDGGGQALSGYALKMSMIDLLEKRQNDIDIYRFYEQELFSVIKSVWNFHNEKKIKDGKFNIDFGEIEFERSVGEEIQEWEFEFRNNISSPIDYLMYKNPDLTPEMAEQIYRDKIKKNKKIGFTFQQPEERQVEEAAE